MVGYLAEALVDQPIKAHLLMAVDVAPEGSRADPQQASCFLLGEAPFRPGAVGLSPFPDLP